MKTPYPINTPLKRPQKTQDFSETHKHKILRIGGFCN